MQFPKYNQSISLLDKPSCYFVMIASNICAGVRWFVLFFSLGVIAARKIIIFVKLFMPLEVFASICIRWGVIQPKCCTAPALRLSQRENIWIRQRFSYLQKFSSLKICEEISRFVWSFQISIKSKYLDCIKHDEISFF